MLSLFCRRGYWLGGGESTCDELLGEGKDLLLGEPIFLFGGRGGLVAHSNII